MENCLGGSCPAGVYSGVSEHGLLPVCLERRQGSLSASERGLCLCINKMYSLFKLTSKSLTFQFVKVRMDCFYVRLLS